MLYEEGMRLKDVTCPCGCGYWDAFAEAFVSGDQIRLGKGASRAAYEAKVKAKMSTEKYEAMLRKQLIEHFLDCKHKRRIDESDPSNDGSTRRRAEAELREISNGDLISRGRTAFQGGVPTLARSGSRGEALGSERYEAPLDRHREMPARHRRDTDPVGSRTRDDLGENVEEQQGRNPPSYAQATTPQQFNATSRQPTGPAAGTPLTPLIRDFVSIPTGDFAASRTFISENPEVMDENGTALLRTALGSLKAGQTQHARSCVEKAVMIHEGVGLSPRGVRDYLQGLIRDSAAREDFLDSFDEAFRKLRQRAEESGPLPTTSLPVGIPVPTASRHGDVRHNRPLVAPASLDTRQAHQGYFPNPLNSSFSNLAISSPARHGSFERSSLSRTQSYNQPGPNIGRRHNSRDKSPRSPSPDSFELKGSEGESEKLDSRYRKRRDAEAFFSIGRVFAVLSHNRAEDRQNPGPEVKFAEYGRSGDKIMSSIRRMVVVRQREGYCLCLDIDTYGGLGVAKPGMTPAEIRAHSIIYDERQTPKRKENERGIVKEPIAVTMAPKQRLHEMSRLNFAKAHTVEWNVKVMEVGRVSRDESMDLLVRYWRNEMGTLEGNT